MINHWSDIEDIHYHFYLILNIQRFDSSSTKNHYVFKEMEAFIQTKNSRQCRSHHKKKCKDNDIRTTLAKFYHHHYQIRLLDGRHSLSELKNYLTKNNMEYMCILSQRRKTKINLQMILQTFETNWKTIFQREQLIIFYKDFTVQTAELFKDKQTQTQFKQNGTIGGSLQFLKSFSKLSENKYEQILVLTNQCRQNLLE